MSAGRRLILGAFLIGLGMVGPLWLNASSMEWNCDKLRGAAPASLIDFLQAEAHRQDEAECITYAIQRLAEARYAPAIPTLAALLEFRRPPNEHEKNHVYLHPPIAEEMYPATEALEEIAEVSPATSGKARHAALEVLEDRAASAKARENAVAVWMEIYRYTSAAEGVALLKREADEASDPAVKQQLLSSVEQALRTPWCRYPAAEQEKCKAAAQTGHVD